MTILHTHKARNASILLLPEESYRISLTTMFNAISTHKHRCKPKYRIHEHKQPPPLFSIPSLVPSCLKSSKQRQTPSAAQQRQFSPVYLQHRNNQHTWTVPRDGFPQITIYLGAALFTFSVYNRESELRLFGQVIKRLLDHRRLRWIAGFTQLFLFVVLLH